MFLAMIKLKFFFDRHKTLFHLRIVLVKTKEYQSLLILVDKSSVSKFVRTKKGSKLLVWSLPLSVTVLWSPLWQRAFSLERKVNL